VPQSRKCMRSIPVWSQRQLPWSSLMTLIWLQKTMQQMLTYVNLIRGKLKILFINLTSSMGALNSTTVTYNTCFHSIWTFLDVYKELISSHFFSSITGTRMNVEKTKVMGILRSIPNTDYDWSKATTTEGGIFQLFG